ncbi:Nn.00g090070.m01.CDS01 [Neocucurbitaria sp. VM-36]
MASLPPQRPASQRRTSPPAESSSSQQEQVARTNSFSAQSIDSQTLLLNSPPKQSAKPAIEAQKEAPAHTTTTPEEDTEPRKCWICFNDETEDDETTSEWRSPCACSLVAHEKCLLDWIADMEAPSSRRRAGTRAAKVLCPQCKSEIVIQRPRSYVVDGVRAVERLTGTLLLPGFALVTGTALYSTLTLSGTHTIYQIFGTEDALQILGPLYETPNPQVGSVALRLLDHLRQHWRLDLGLPLIPTVLVASRTTFADSFLPFLPLIFFVSSGQPGDEMLQLQWPPGAAFSFAALPYLRGFYNAYYDRVWLPREQKWLKEIQPRAGEDTAADAQAQGDDGHVHDDEGFDGGVVDGVEIEVDFDIFADWNNGGDADNHDAQENPPVPIARGPARRIDAPPLDDDAIPELIDVNGNAQEGAPAPNIPAQPAVPRRQRVRRERNIAFSTTSLADTILGALIFPSIAAAMGELLKHSLPSSWVTPPAGVPATSWLGGWVNNGGKAGGAGKPTGFLQTRWGRSIVGGCLFVGLKDAVLLYMRWKMAQNHRRRKILDYDDKGKKKRASTAGS